MFYAIHTRFLPPTDHRGARIKASLDRCSVVIPYPYELQPEAAHVHAAHAVLRRVKASRPEETHRTEWTWNQFHSGELPDGSFAHVFV